MSGNIAETEPGYPVGMSEGSVTVSITRKVDPAKRSQANAWARAGQELCSAKPGYLGSGWIQVGEHSDEWHMLFRFRDSETLHAWEVSPEREWWLSTAQGLVEHSRVERRTGIEGWFDEPKEVLLEQPGVVPPRWKQAFSIYLAFLPLNLLANFTLGMLLTAWNWPLVARIIVITTLLTPLMTYFFLPLSTRMLRPWLHATPRSRRRRR